MDSQILCWYKHYSNKKVTSENFIRFIQNHKTDTKCHYDLSFIKRWTIHTSIWKELEEKTVQAETVTFTATTGEI